VIAETTELGLGQQKLISKYYYMPRTTTSKSRDDFLKSKYLHQQYNATDITTYLIEVAMIKICNFSDCVAVFLQNFSRNNSLIVKQTTDHSTSYNSHHHLFYIKG